MSGKNLEKFRKAKGYPHAIDFAKEIGMHRSNLSRIESGKEQIPRKYVKRICEVLNITEDQLFDTGISDDLEKELIRCSLAIVGKVISDPTELTEEERLEYTTHAYTTLKSLLKKNMDQSQIDIDDSLRQLSKKIEIESEVTKNFSNFFSKINKTSKNG